MKNRDLAGAVDLISKFGHFQYLFRSSRKWVMLHRAFNIWLCQLWMINSYDALPNKCRSPPMRVWWDFPFRIHRDQSQWTADDCSPATRKRPGIYSLIVGFNMIRISTVLSGRIGHEIGGHLPHLYSPVHSLSARRASFDRISSSPVWWRTLHQCWYSFSISSE